MFLQAIDCLERILIQAQKQKTDGILLEKPKNEEFFDADKEINVDPKTYCKLGHFHLLLEEYAKGEFLLSEPSKISIIHTRTSV